MLARVGVVPLAAAVTRDGPPVENVELPLAGMGSGHDQNTVPRDWGADDASARILSHSSR